MSLITYQFQNYIRSFMFIPPVAIYIAWICVLYSYNSLPVVSSYANSAVALYLILTWITMNFFGIEEEAEKHILLVHLKQKEHFLHGKWINCFLILLLLLFIAELYPILANRFASAVGLMEHSLSLYSHIGLGILGILTGSFFAGTRYAQSRSVWLLCALTVTASLAYSQLADMLPKWIGWILWVLPPLRLFYEPLNAYESTGTASGLFSSFCIGIFYIVIAALIVQHMFLKKEKV